METGELLRIAGICLGSYLLGSIPFSLIVGKIKGVDIRKAGSHNIGATNTGRQLGRWYGALAASLDIWKAVFPVVTTRYFFPESMWPVSFVWLSAFLGHRFSIWFKFKGGRGVSVFFGGLLGLLGWQSILIILGCWIIVLIWSKKMSATNLAIGAGILLFIFAIPALVRISPVVAIIVLLMWWAHQDNVKRLARGEEPSIKVPSPREVINWINDKLRLLSKKIQNYQKRGE